MSSSKLKLIVVGSINTDIILHGVDKILGKNELTGWGTLKIGPGGKSRNMAEMTSWLMKKGEVGFIGKTAKDEFGLWEVHLKALKESGVNTDFISFEKYKEGSAQTPGIALIPVDKSGNNQIYLSNSANSRLTLKDLKSAEKLFKIAGKNNGGFLLSSESEPLFLNQAIKYAQKFKLKVFYDPGGIDSKINFNKIVDKTKIFLLKPNEFEAEIISGIKIKNFESAKKCADKIFKKFSIENILITHGSKGGYFFDHTGKGLKIPISKNLITSKETDATGCGDQTIAAICASLFNGKNIEEAVRIGINAGTMQYNKIGIQPIKTLRGLEA